MCVCVCAIVCVCDCVIIFISVYICVHMYVCLLQPGSQLLVGLHNPFDKHLFSALHWMADKDKLIFSSLDFLNAGLTTNSIF